MGDLDNDKNRKMKIIILILSLFICNFAFSQTWVIPYYPNKGDTMYSYVDTVPKRRYRFKELEPEPPMKFSDTILIKDLVTRESIYMGAGITNQYQRGDATFSSLYAGDTLIVLPNPSILSAIQIEKGTIRVHLSEVASDSITIISVDESKKVTKIKYKLLKF